MDNSRYLLAFIISPWAAPLGYELFLFVLSGDWPNGEHQWFSGVVVAGVAAGYLGLIVIGLPVVALLRQVGLLSVPLVSFAGAVAGILVFTAALKLFAYVLGSSANMNVIQLLWGAGIGLVVALVFSLIAGIPLHSKIVKYWA